MSALPLGCTSSWDFGLDGAPDRRVVTVRIPIRTVSEANSRSCWQVKAKRVKSQRMIVGLCLAGVFASEKLTAPCEVTLTRLGPGTLDDDNNVSSFKAVRDAIAALLGVDDRSKSVAWKYAQRREKDWGVEVRVRTGLPDR